MGYAAAIDKARVKVGAKASKFLPDTCTIKAPGTESKDAAGWDVAADATVEVDGDDASSIPCSYSSLSTFERVAGGAVTQSATHRLRMPVNEFTMTINGGQRLVVAARGSTPELTFDVTGRLDSSTDLMLLVAAVLR